MLPPSGINWQLISPCVPTIRKEVLKNSPVWPSICFDISQNFNTFRIVNWINKLFVQFHLKLEKTPHSWRKLYKWQHFRFNFILHHLVSFIIINFRPRTTPQLLRRQSSASLLNVASAFNVGIDTIDVLLSLSTTRPILAKLLFLSLTLLSSKLVSCLLLN